MKNIALIAVLCIAVGFGAGWLARRTAPEPAHSGVPSKQGSRPDRDPAAGSGTAAGTSQEDDPAATKTGPRPEPSEEMQELARQQQDRIRNAMIERQKAQHGTRLTKLVETLGLTPGQEAQLREFFDKNREALAAMFGPEHVNDWTMGMDTAALIRADGLDELLAGMLDDDQKATYESLKAREHEKRVEAQAYQDLSRIQQVLDLADDQKDAVYEILHDQAGAELSANKDARALMSVWTEAIGIDIDPEGLGIAQAFQAQMERARKDGNPEDPNAWMAAVKDNLDQHIQRKVQALGGVLTGPQQVLYRQHLETKAKTLGIFMHTAGENSDLVGPE